VTSRVLFLGNSHIAALREAWGLQPDGWPGMHATFVGAHKDLLLKTRFDKGIMVPDAPETAQAFRRLGGVTKINLAAFDHIVITGCMVALPQALLIYRDARWPGLPSLEAASDVDGSTLALVSRATARAAMAEVIGDKLGPQLIRHLRKATARPIWLTSQPRPSAQVEEAPSPGTNTLRAVLENGDGLDVSAHFDAAATMACAEAGATFLSQPRVTIHRDVLTALPFMRGAKRLSANGDQPQPEDDIMHANADYGALVLSQVEAAVTGHQA
jgi:hypothetical protein